MQARFALLFCLACAACSAPAPTPSASTAAPAMVAAQPAQPRFDPAKIDAMKKALLAEPRIGDVMYQDGPARVAWTVAVRGDGTSQRGFADYVCTVLAGQQLVGAHTDVRVVDIAGVQSGDFRAASLGHVDCATSEDLGT